MADDGPSRIPDLTVVRGEDKYVRFTFTNPDGTARNLTGASFSSTMRNWPDAVWAWDLTNAATGIVVGSLTAAQTAKISDPSVFWSVAEANIFHRTILTGRFILQDQ